MSFCKNCGNLLKENTSFCPRCGVKTEASTEEKKKENQPKKIIVKKQETIQSIPKKKFPIYKRLKIPAFIIGGLLVIFLIILIYNQSKLTSSSYIMEESPYGGSSPAQTGAYEGQKQTYCGNNVCESGEDFSSCCVDCGCPDNYLCSENRCKRKAELKELSYPDITKSFVLTDEYNNEHYCNQQSQCFITDTQYVNDVSILMDDPSFLPKKLKGSFVIPLENLGDEMLSGIAVSAYLNGKIIQQETLNLMANERRIITIEASQDVILGDKYSELVVEIKTSEQHYQFSFNIKSSLLMALLSKLSVEDLSYDNTVQLHVPSINNDHEQDIPTKNFKCTSQIGCSMSYSSGRLSIAFEPYTFVVQNQVTFALPVKNVGNKKFSQVYVSEPFYFLKTNQRYASLEPGEAAIIFAKIDLNDDLLEVYDVKVNSVKDGYGKTTSLRLLLNYEFNPYYNLQCVKRGDYTGISTIFVDYKNPSIKKLAESIIKYPATSQYSYENVNEIYIWVLKNTGTIGDWDNSIKYASIVYQDRWGDCDDRSNLIVALARAVNVPAESIRVQVANVCNLGEDDASCYESPKAAHGWVTFDYDGKTYDLESRDMAQDFLAKVGLPLGIKAGHLFHKGFYVGLERFLNIYYYNDQYCVDQYP